MDSDHTGLVTRDEWHVFLKETHDSCGVEGRDWLAALLQTLQESLARLSYTFENVSVRHLHRSWMSRVDSMLTAAPCCDRYPAF